MLKPDDLEDCLAKAWEGDIKRRGIDCLFRFWRLKSRQGLQSRPAAAEEAKMRAPYTELYVHIIWATWDRLPLLIEEIEVRVYASIAVKCRELDCEPLAIGGIVDHVHLLAKINPVVSVADLVKEVKGSSSHLVTHEIRPGEFFKWQGAYRAFTVRKKKVEYLREYIRNQKSHHTVEKLNLELEI